MAISRKAISDWMWEGGPERRLLVSVGVSVVVLAVPLLDGWQSSKSLLPLFLGWDLGAWFMDKVYVDRLMRRNVVAG